MLSTKCEYLGFEKYVHTVLKVQELNSAHANLESVPFSKLQYKYLDTPEGVWDKNTRLGTGTIVHTREDLFSLKD